MTELILISPVPKPPITHFQKIAAQMGAAGFTAAQAMKAFRMAYFDTQLIIDFDETN